MPLNPFQCEGATPKEKDYTLTDGDGLILNVRVNGRKVWEFRYRLVGKQKRLILGEFPSVSLKQARTMRTKARKTLDAGGDPRDDDMSEYGPKSFRFAADFWFNNEIDRWSPVFAKRVWNRVERDLMPFLGDMALGDIARRDVLEALRSIEARGSLATARIVGGYARDIFALAISEEWAETNPATELNRSLKPKPKVKHNPRLPESELPGFFSKLAGYHGDRSTVIGLKLVLHTFVRTKELIGKREGGIHVPSVTADELDFNEMLWRIPRDRMKRNIEHIVPLTNTTASLFEELVADAEPGAPLFSMSNNTLIYALYRMGYHTQATVHGLRSTASTILNESAMWRPDVIERQLSHAEGDDVRAAYNAAEYLPERRKMMEWYSDRLNQLERSAIAPHRPKENKIDDLLNGGYL